MIAACAVPQPIDQVLLPAALYTDDVQCMGDIPGSQSAQPAESVVEGQVCDTLTIEGTENITTQQKRRGPGHVQLGYAVAVGVHARLDGLEEGDVGAAEVSSGSDPVFRTFSEEDVTGGGVKVVDHDEDL